MPVTTPFAKRSFVRTRSIARSTSAAGVEGLNSEIAYSNGSSYSRSVLPDTTTNNDQLRHQLTVANKNLTDSVVIVKLTLLDPERDGIADSFRF